MFDELCRCLGAARLPLPFDNDGADAGDLWADDDGGRYIGNIDEPLYAAAIVALVNAAPALVRLVTASQRRIIAVRAYEAWHSGMPQSDRDGIVEEMDAADAAIRSALAALEVNV